MHVTSKTGQISRTEDLNKVNKHEDACLAESDRYKPEPVKQGQVIFVKKIDPKHHW